MAELDDWKQSLEQLRVALIAVAEADGPDAARLQFTEAISMTNSWADNRRIFALGQLSPQFSVLACREGLMPWWQALAGQTYFGNLDGLRTVHAAMEENLGKSTAIPDLSCTMTWGAWDYSIVAGAPPVFSGDVMSQLFDWGADPNFSDESYYKKALQGSPSGVIRAFLDHGASVKTARQVSDELTTAKSFEQAQQVQSALGMGGFYAKVDDATVMETKYVRAQGRDSVFSILFNFAAQRVSEIFETTPGGQTPPAMTGHAFADYDTGAIETARQALEKLGGRPVPYFSRLDKPKKPQLATR